MLNTPTTKVVAGAITKESAILTNTVIRAAPTTVILKRIMLVEDRNQSLHKFKQKNQYHSLQMGHYGTMAIGVETAS